MRVRLRHRGREEKHLSPYISQRFEFDNQATELELKLHHMYPAVTQASEQVIESEKQVGLK